MFLIKFSILKNKNYTIILTWIISDSVFTCTVENSKIVHFKILKLLISCSQKKPINLKN